MIKTLHLDNYKCFKSLSAPMKRLTVAIGKNNTGKSTFWESIARLPANGAINLADPKVTFQGQGAVARIRVADGIMPGVATHFAIPPLGPTMVSSGVVDGSGPPKVSLNFAAAFVDWCLRHDRDRFFTLIDAMKSAVPGLVDIIVAVPQPQNRRLDLKMEGGWTVPADQSSAGTKTILFFQALLHHPSPPKLLLFEEIENGLHPKRLAEVVGILRDVSKAGTQVVMTTHSPYLLDLVDPSEEQVLVFSRLDDGQCVAKPLATDKVAVFLDEFGLGEVWSNEGEQGLV